MTAQSRIAPDLAPFHSSTAPGEGERFEFGANWRRFLRGLDEARIAEAEESIREMLRVDSLDGRTILDIGSGSGLFSLAAMRLGAARVHSLDVDPQCVACTEELRRRYFAGSTRWSVELGDATDAGYIRSLGRFDLVYSWGVLHHTGAMWRGLLNACDAVGESGVLFIALYNDLGWRSRAWRAVKRAYVRAPRALRPLILVPAGGLVAMQRLHRHGRARDLTGFVRHWSRTGERGTSGWHDLVDWVGGYPFEVAKPDEVVEFCRAHGFRLAAIREKTGHTNNEFVFARDGR